MMAKKSKAPTSGGKKTMNSADKARVDKDASKARKEVSKEGPAGPNMPRSRR